MFNVVVDVEQMSGLPTANLLGVYGTAGVPVCFIFTMRFSHSFGSAF
jgi:hypothetical protein